MGPPALVVNPASFFSASSGAARAESPRNFRLCIFEIERGSPLANVLQRDASFYVKLKLIVQAEYRLARLPFSPGKVGDVLNLTAFGNRLFTQRCNRIPGSVV